MNGRSPNVPLPAAAAAAAAARVTGLLTFVWWRDASSCFPPSTPSPNLTPVSPLSPFLTLLPFRPAATSIIWSYKQTQELAAAVFAEQTSGAGGQRGWQRREARGKEEGRWRREEGREAAHQNSCNPRTVDGTNNEDEEGRKLLKCRPLGAKPLIGRWSEVTAGHSRPHPAAQPPVWSPLSSQQQPVASFCARLQLQAAASFVSR